MNRALFHRKERDWIVSSARRFWRMIIPLSFVLASMCRLAAWEGHDWNQWRQVTTWRKPERQGAQAGRPDLLPLLEPEASSTQRRLSLPDWEQRRGEAASVIQSILGAPSNLTPPAVEVRELGREELDGYTRRHLLIRTEPDDWIPAYLLVPKILAKTRVPAMLCLHQTVAQGKEEPCGIKGDPEMAFAIELVQRGFVCLAPDVIGFGERIPPGSQPYHDSLAFYRKHPGWSFMGKMVWDVGRAIDFLETLPMVDPKRIGSIGHSHGAYGTLFATAFEPRLSAAVASCGFTTFRSDPHPERWSHLTALMPQLGFYLPDAASIPFDWQHVLALAAPRRLFVYYATQDSIFPRTENLGALLMDVRRVYGLYGAENALVWEAFDGPHRFPRAARERAYRWLEVGFESNTVAASATAGSRSGPVLTKSSPGREVSAFFPLALVGTAQANARTHAWAAAIRDPIVAAAKPWKELSDDHLWGLMFGNTLPRAWQVWSDGYCPACRKPVPMYEWIADALNQPWKMRCPQCQELFPKNDFLAFYRSGLNVQGIFEPGRADHSLLFNTEHPDPADPLHRFGVDDGDGYVEDGKRWRFINTYLIFGQWKQAIVNGIRNLAAAYVVTGDFAYAHKAGVLLDRVADLYPSFDFGKEGIMYEGPARSGYVSTWHDACQETRQLALAYDMVREALAKDALLAEFLADKATHFSIAAPKSSPGAILRNIENGILRDPQRHPDRIYCNFPQTEMTIAILKSVLNEPGDREAAHGILEDVLTKACAVDGLTGEKGLTGYTVYALAGIADVLMTYGRAEPAFMNDLILGHPRLAEMFRFHIDVWCGQRYYPRIGDCGSFAQPNPAYAALSFTKTPGLSPSMYDFLWQLYENGHDPAFVQTLYHANGDKTEGLPYDLFAAAPARFQQQVEEVIKRQGAVAPARSVDKKEWHLAVLKGGAGARQHALWLDYDSGGYHAHADGLNIGLFACGLDLLPDFGYPPVQFGGWGSPRATWYTMTAAHNTVVVDGRNQRNLAGPLTERSGFEGRPFGKTTLWADGMTLQAVRAEAPEVYQLERYERTAAIANVSEDEFYVFDLFRVRGGHDHARMTYSGFGSIATDRLAQQPAPDYGNKTQLRGFRTDPQPRPGWSVDWTIEDRYRQLDPGESVHLRLTDLTEGAEASVAEAWVAPGGDKTDGEWINAVMTRRRQADSALASDFVSILQPYRGKPFIASAQRIPVESGGVAVEVRLLDGRRDLLIAGGPADQVQSVPAGDGSTVGFTGDLCLVRFGASDRPTRVVFCRARSLKVGELVVRAKDPDACFEVDLNPGAAPTVTGATRAVDVIEAAGVRLWPK